MQSEEVQVGRTFVIRLEQGEIIHKSIEKFSKERKIISASLFILGGADRGSRLIVGPTDDQKRPVSPLEEQLDDPHEIVGTGTIFPDEQGYPKLHMHVSCGRDGKTVTGCIRAGVICWQVLEIVLFELKNCTGRRILDSNLGFELLQI